MSDRDCPKLLNKFNFAKALMEFRSQKKEDVIASVEFYFKNQEVIHAVNHIRECFRYGEPLHSDETFRLALECEWVPNDEKLQWMKPKEKAPKVKNGKQNGYVYVMQNKRNGFIKIGFSTNPAYRESTLQSEEPEVHLLHAIQGTRDDERNWHNRFDDKRMRGEWFALSDEELELIFIKFNELQPS